MKKILVPLDGSALADRAIPFAATIAARADWSLLLLRAVNTLAAPTEGAGVALKREAQASLDARAAALTADGVKVSTRVVDRQAEPAILEATADLEVGLIVMSTHGRGGFGRFVYGSVADTVLREAPVPVLTVPPHGLDDWPADRRVKILVPLDGSVLSTAALAPAAELADFLGGSLLLASVITFPSYAAYAEGYMFTDPAVTESVLAETRHHLEGLAAQIRTETRPVNVCTTYGSPYFGITNIARRQGVGLIVMATHGRGGMTRALLGSVATAILRQTDIPIVLVRPDTVGLRDQDVEPATPEAQGAGESPSVQESAPTTPSVTISLSPDQLKLLKGVVGERFYDRPVDPRGAEPTRLLLEKLRMAQPTSGPATPAKAAAPARPVRA
jgi:nucleotide-binding universal stress UspA family protein